MVESVASVSAATSPKIAVLLHDLRGGGAERVTLKLVKGMLAAGRDVDVVLVQAKGEYLDLIPKGARLVDLNRPRVLDAVFALASYLKKERPRALLASLTHVNILAVLAKLVARTPTRVVISERNQISLKVSMARGLREKLTYFMVPALYRVADDIVAVSKGVAEDLDRYAGFKPGRVKAIYNPVYDQSMTLAAAETPTHPWLAPGAPPVVLSAGRLNEQKGFDVLIDAFAQVRQSAPARLVIIGEGDERAALQARIDALGLKEHADLAGFNANPYAMMSRAAVYALSSRFEGLPGALLEAMACGTPVVATNCPSGPDEILEGGRYGALVPVGDASALAAGILKALEEPRGKGLARAQAFTVEASTSTYLSVLERA